MAQALEKDEVSELTDLPVGEVLRRTRLHYGQSPTDVEKNTRIRAHLITAIEENDIEKLPARVYVIGFVRSYSEYLGLDGDKMVELLKVQAGVQEVGPEIYAPTEADDQYSPPIWLVLLTLCVVLIVSGVWSSNWDEGRKEIEKIPPVPEEIQKAAMGIEDAGDITVQNVELGQESASPVKEPVALPAEPERKGIILNIRENSWVEVRQRGGKRLISRVLKAGDQYFVPDRPDLTMSIGNAAGVELEVDGISLKPLGNPAQVKRNIPLDAEILKRDYAP